MKLISYTHEQKDYNGMPYVEFNLRLQDGNVKRVVKLTGKIPVQLVEPTGNVVELGRLDKCGLPLGSELDFWLDLQNRVSLIEVHSEDPEPVPPPSDDNIPF